MAVEVQLKGFDALDRRLRALPDKIERKVMRTTLRSAANKVATRLRNGTPTASGTAKKQVKVKKVRSSNLRAFAVIGYKGRPALYMTMRERGGRQGHQKPRPFFQQAVAGFETEVRADFEASLRDAVEKAEG